MVPQSRNKIQDPRHRATNHKGRLRSRGPTRSYGPDNSIGPWLDQQPDEIPYDDLKKHLLKEFSPTTSERARRLLSLPSQPMGDRKPSHLWDEICTLSRLPEVETAQGS